MTISSWASMRARPASTWPVTRYRRTVFEGRHPPADPDPVALAQGFEPIVVAHGVAIVLRLMANEIDPHTATAQAQEAPIVIHGPIADRA